MFYFRINKVKILKNREAVLFWEKDEAEVELWSFITTDSMLLPDLDSFLEMENSQERRAWVEGLVRKVISARKIAPINNIRDGHEMTFGDTGFVLYESSNIPDSLSWNFLAIERDDHNREQAHVADMVLNSPEFEPFSENLVTSLTKAANPALAAVVSASRFVSEVILQELQHNRDDLIGTLFLSLNRREHYPHGERKRDNVPDLTNNMWIDYSLFGVEA